MFLARELLGVIREDPLSDLPSFEALFGDLKGGYSHRINIQHRLVYQVYAEEQSVIVILLWAHYG